MELSIAKKNLTKIGSVLGFCQGLAWTVLSLIVIGLHYGNPADYVTEVAGSYNRYIQLLLYNVFIHKDAVARSNFIIRPDEFIIFAWIYFVLSLIWTIISGFQYFVFKHNKKRAETIMLVWGTLTLIISLIDFIFVCLLGRDYDECSDSFLLNNDVSCYLAYGIVLTIIARGFLLWVINVIFALLLRNFSLKIKLIKKSSKLATEPSSLYESPTIPRIPQADYIPYNGPRGHNQSPILRQMSIPGNNAGFQDFGKLEPSQSHLQPYRNPSYY